MSFDSTISIEEFELPKIKSTVASKSKLITINPVIKVSQKKLNKIDLIIPIKPKKTFNTNLNNKEKLNITKIKLLKNTSKGYKKNNHNLTLEPINYNNLKNNTFFQSTNNKDKRHLINF